MIVSNYRWASYLLNVAKSTYDEQKKICENKEKAFKEELEKLDKLKLQIWASFSDFIETYNKINRIVEITGDIKAEDAYKSLNIHDLTEISKTSKIAADIINDSVKSAASGIAASTTLGAATSLISAVAAMGLSWVGVPGGFAVATSMAEVTLASMGIMVSPLVVFAIPAFLVSGIAMNSMSKNEVKKSQQTFDKAMEDCRKMNSIIDEIDTAKLCVIELSREIKKLDEFYNFKLNALKKIVKEKNDFSLFSEDEQYTLSSTIILLKMLKDLMSKELFKKSTDGTVECDWQKQLDLVDGFEKRRIEMIANEQSNYSDKAISQVFCFAENEKAGLTKSSDSKEKYSIKDETIHKNQELRIYNKSVYINDVFEINGSMCFVDCDICINNTGKYAIMVMGGSLSFKNCTIRTENLAKNAEILVVDGKLMLHNCTLNNVKYNNIIDKNMQDNNPSKGFICAHGDEHTVVSLYNCHISNCQGTFIFAERNVKVILNNDYIKNHADNFVCTSFCSSVTNSGLFISDCQFIGSHLRVKYRNLGTLDFHRKKNALIVADSIFECRNSKFSNCKSFIMSVDNALSNNKCSVFDCIFENIEFSNDMEQMRFQGTDSNNLISLTGLVAVENCKFNNVTGIEIGNMGCFEDCAGYINNCSFNNYNGRLWIEYGGISNSIFEDSDMILELAGKNEHSDKNVTYAQNLAFLNCRGMYAQPGFFEQRNKAIISCGSYLDKSGIAVKIDDCYFYKCGNIDSPISTYIMDLGSFGRERHITVGLVGDNISDSKPSLSTLETMGAHI